MNTQTVITESKRFVGPLLCLAGGYATLACLRFTLHVILDWDWGVTTPPRVSYISGGLVIVMGLAAALSCSGFVLLGWQWFRARASKT
jgi:hypothetical protein